MKRLMVLFLMAALLMVFGRTFAQDAPQAGQVWQVTADSAMVRIAATVDAPPTDKLSKGDLVNIKNVFTESDGSIWVEIQNGYSAAFYDGSWRMQIAADQTAVVQSVAPTASSVMNADGTLNPFPGQVVMNNGVTIGLLYIQGLDPNQTESINRPEGGATYVVTSNCTVDNTSNLGGITLFVLPGTPGDGVTPNDKNATPQLKSGDSGCQANVIVLNSVTNIEDMTNAVLAQLIGHGANPVNVFNDGSNTPSQVTTAPESSVDLGLRLGEAPIATFAATGETMYMPADGIKLPTGDEPAIGYFFSFGVNKPNEIPVAQGGHTIFAFGPGTIELDSEHSIKGNPGRGDRGTVVIVLGYDQNGVPVPGLHVRISDFVAGHAGVTSIYGGTDEKVDWAALNAVKGMFHPQNCGDAGCTGGTDLYVVYWNSETNTWADAEQFQFATEPGQDAVLPLKWQPQQS